MRTRTTRTRSVTGVSGVPRWRKLQLAERAKERRDRHARALFLQREEHERLRQQALAVPGLTPKMRKEINEEYDKRVPE